jgi:Na+(H+)/acetate symporter ActP
LGPRRPLLNAAALAIGHFTTCAVIGISGLVLFGGAQSTVSTVGRLISTTIRALLIVLVLRSLLGSPIKVPTRGNSRRQVRAAETSL